MAPRSNSPLIEGTTTPVKRRKRRRRVAGTTTSTVRSGAATGIGNPGAMGGNISGFSPMLKTTGNHAAFYLRGLADGSGQNPKALVEYVHVIAENW